MSAMKTPRHAPENLKAFVPQALADPESRSVLFVWRDEQEFRRHWADKVKTFDAAGLPTHPRLVKIGDTIDWFITGWSKGVVTGIEFIPDSSDIPEWHRSGSFRFTTESGYTNVRVDGRQVIGAPIFVFPK
jgi:hypothetical protein